MDFKCQCGSEEFHIFMRYKSIDKMRFRCEKCSRTYEYNRGYIKELDMQKMWEEAIKHI